MLGVRLPLFAKVSLITEKNHLLIILFSFFFQSYLVKNSLQ